ncbi:MAG: zeta toxin, partial [Candidatus Moranbacteria bacterium]|nr:zeta toxin [Candidatus Moranbacteria bacterium]
ASYSVLPEMLNCKEFVNADEIAKGLSPFQPDQVAIDAGRIMLKRIRELIKNQVDFAFETTLAPKSFVKLIREAQAKGYFVTLVYFWLNSPELAVRRVETRVKLGGHNIPVEIIYRRYWAGIENLAKLFLPLSDFWMIIDNSEAPFQVIAEGNTTKNIEIHNKAVFNKIVQL